MCSLAQFLAEESDGLRVGERKKARDLQSTQPVITYATLLDPVT